MNSRHLQQQPGTQRQQPAKIERLRAGKVPTWAQEKPQSSDPSSATTHLNRGGTSSGTQQPNKGLRFTGMTADSSAILIDTSMGQKNTDTVLKEQVEHFQQLDGEEAVPTTSHQSGGANRAQTALLLRQKLLKAQDEEEGEDSDDLFGDEDDDAIAGPTIVVPDRGGDESDQEFQGKRDASKIEDDFQVINKDKNQRSGAGSASSSGDSEVNSEGEDSDDDQKMQMVDPLALKPVFVSKIDREMLEPCIQLKEREQKEKEAKELGERLEEQRKEFTAKMVTDSIVKDKEAAEKEAVLAMDSDANLPSSSEDEEEGNDKPLTVKGQALYEAWKVRELRRILRDREELEEYEKELAEVERRRKMTEEEREAENAALGTDHTEKKQKVAYNFMQKYYHKGAFFQGNEEESGLTAAQQALLTRDYNMPTGEDKMDKSVLPAVLQKRAGTFGKKGNSKWTHLTDADTTNFDPSTKVQEGIAFKFQSRQGGFKGMNAMERPTKRKRKY